jgi:hypothetical protein
MTRTRPTTLARTLRAFFADQLPSLRGLSPHTIRSYRDSLVLLRSGFWPSRSCVLQDIPWHSSGCSIGS